MKRIFLIALLVMMISSVGFFQTEGNNALASDQKVRNGLPKKVLVADLACSITASLDEAGTQPITNGGNTNHFEAWVRFKVTNNGPGKAENFKVKRSIIDGSGQKIYDPAAEPVPTLKKGDVVAYAPFRISLGGGRITADMSVDVERVVAEKKLSNNQCKFSFLIFHQVPPKP